MELIQISGEVVGDPDHDEVAGHSVDTPDHLTSSTPGLAAAAAHWTGRAAVFIFMREILPPPEKS